MSITLFLLANLAFPPAQSPQSAQSGLPHPTFPVLGIDAGDLEAGPWDGRRWWAALQPSWSNGNQVLLEDALREALLERVAASFDGGETELANWVQMTAPSALTLNYRIMVDSKEALAGRESVPMGRAVSFGDLTRNSCILDFDVEIASGSGIFDPIMGTQYSGSSLALQILPVPGKGWVAEVGMAHSRRLPGEPIAMKYAQVSGKERLIERIAEVGGHGLLTPHQSVAFELPNLGPGRITLELIADSPAPSGVIVLSETLAWVALPNLAHSEQWETLMSDWDQKRSIWSNSQGDLVFEGADAAEAAKAAMVLEQSQVNPVQVLLDVQRILGGVEGEDSSLHAVVLENTNLRFAQGTVRDALVEWDVEVAQVARIADPRFVNLFSGWNGDLRARHRADGLFEVDLDLSFSVVDVSIHRDIRLAAATLGEKGYDGNVPASPAHTMEVETPEVKEVRFHGTYLSDKNGRIVLIRSANSVLGEAGRLRIEIQLSQP
ncbi:MAG: hypothetical protein QM477_01055 [Planctomycetota bacterium]